MTTLQLLKITRTEFTALDRKIKAGEPEAIQYFFKPWADIDY